MWSFALYMPISLMSSSMLTGRHFWEATDFSHFVSPNQIWTKFFMFCTKPATLVSSEGRFSTVFFAIKNFGKRIRMKNAYFRQVIGNVRNLNQNLSTSWRTHCQTIVHNLYSLHYDKKYSSKTMTLPCTQIKDNKRRIINTDHYSEYEY